MKIFLVGLLCASAVSGALAADGGFFHPTDPLARRDEWGTLHQSAEVNDTDFAHRYRWRLFYYLESGKTLKQHPEYIAALQAALRQKGYYCGEADGVFTPEVSEAIARLQRNCSMRVTGTLTRAVRRVLFLP